PDVPRPHRGLDRPARAGRPGALAGLRPSGLRPLRPPPARPAGGPADHHDLRAAADLPHPVAPRRTRGRSMNLLAVGCSYRNTPVEVRERLAFDAGRLGPALDVLCARFDCEAVILSTCNRVELYLGQVLDGPAAPAEGEAVAAFLAEFHGLP